MNPGIIIQARTASRRFPNKVFADLAGKPVIEWVVEACRAWGDTVLAVPTEDDGLFNGLGVPVFHGPQDDVLSRYHMAARVFEFDPVVRITADCPLIHRGLIDRTYNEFLDCRTYAAIDWPRGDFPKGYGCEIFSFFALELANAHAVIPADREHVTPWMQRNLRCRYLKNDRDESHLNYCVDYPEDIAGLEKIIGENQNHA